PVSEVQGEPIYQSYIGSSANPGYRDLAIAARMVDGRRVADGVSFDINPASRQILSMLTDHGNLGNLIQAGARIHQAGCNGCIGMGQAPATGRNSLRTVPRNFPGRSGTPEDSVWLCSPETATVSALKGCIADPRSLDMPYVNPEEPVPQFPGKKLIVGPSTNGKQTELIKGPNIKSLPEFEPIGERSSLPVLLIAGDDVSTDEILPAGSRVLPFRSNIPEISKFSFERVDRNYANEAMNMGRKAHMVVGGDNYGQGSSREHAAVAPRYLGLSVVLAKSFARIHRANLINFGILPLVFTNSDDYGRIQKSDTLDVKILSEEKSVTVHNLRDGSDLSVTHDLNDREWDILMAGGLTLWIRKRFN
ncbi:MAG: aconitate hydratase, partial [Verrucomicrobiae bacterium]|nr:aconitate hydratase [Verrucomicrobiae bacterium]